MAYRYFSTEKRKFIIADTPGSRAVHPQHGDRRVDLPTWPIILIDARHGVLPQTKRHTFITSLLGIEHLAVAVNKMDLVDFSEDRFNEIVDHYREFADKLSLAREPYFLPMSALRATTWSSAAPSSTGSTATR